MDLTNRDVTDILALLDSLAYTARRPERRTRRRTRRQPRAHARINHEPKNR
jgi:hypothetical protein